MEQFYERNGLDETHPATKHLSVTYIGCNGQGASLTTAVDPKSHIASSTYKQFVCYVSFPGKSLLRIHVLLTKAGPQWESLS